MAFPITGNKIAVSVSGASELLTLFGTSPTTGTVRVQKFTINADAPEQEVTGNTAATVNSRAYILGLAEATIEVEGLYPKILSAATATTPRLGNSSLITYGAGSVYNVAQFSLEIEYGAIDITGMDGTAIAARRFMPSGVVSWRGSWTSRHSSGVALTIPGATNQTPGSGGTAATFKLTEDGTDPGFTGNIIVPRGPRFSVDPRGVLVEAAYDFVGDGDLTVSAAGSTLPALLSVGAIGPSAWDTTGDGVPDVVCTFTAYTGRTYTASCFLRNLKIDFNVGQPLKVMAALQVSDAMVAA